MKLFVKCYNHNINKHIALVHQNNETREYFKKLLIESGFKITEYSSEMDLISTINSINIDLIISAFELTTIDGETFYKTVLELEPNMYFIFIGSTRDEEIITKVLMFQNCDYMVQPIVPQELLARVSALLLPQNENESTKGLIKVKSLTLDTDSKRAIRDKKEIILTPTEYSLLQYLMENAGTVLSRDMILNKVWKTTENVSDRVVDVYIGYLREKIDMDHKEKLLETVVGFGYKINK